MGSVCKTCVLVLLFLLFTSSVMYVTEVKPRNNPPPTKTKQLSPQEQQKQYIIDQALKAGVKQETLDYVFKHLTYTPKIVKYDRKQPEFSFKFSKYMNSMVSEERVSKARKYYFKHKKILDAIAGEYGVPPQYLVALWGLETNFGTIKPKFRLANSLYSMAMDNRRREFFVREFITALLMYEKYEIDIINTKSSWAGAFGQFQFMPSSFMKYAVDYDKDGKPDIVDSVPDAIASAANYLKKAGWKKDEKWGRAVILPKKFNWNKHLENKERTLSEWKKLGIKNFKGGELPDSDIKAKLLLPMGHNDAAFLVYRNFDAIYSWNHADFYVIAIGYLADRITLSDKITFKSSAKAHPSFEELAKLQTNLCKLGFYKDKLDGSFGSKTKRALILFQKSEGLPPDGYPSPKIIEMVAKKAEINKSFSCEP